MKKEQKNNEGVKSEYYANAFPTNLSRSGVWEVDIGELPMAPIPGILVVGHDSLFIFNMELVVKDDPFEAFRDAILKGVITHETLPESFMVKSVEIAEILRPVAKEIGVVCRVVEKLKAIPEVRKDMTKMFGGKNDFFSRPPKRAKKEVKKEKKLAKDITFSKNPKEIFQFKVTLHDVSPTVWRRILVPSDYTFFELYCAIEDAMGWYGGHLHQFAIEKKGTSRPTFISMPSPEDNTFDFSDNLDERTEKIADYFGKTKKQCLYEYDFGDGWEHVVLLEKILPVVPNEKFPQCIDGKNACPPDDCGGVWGYDNLKKIIKNPKHEEHEGMLEWLDLDSAEDFNPTDFDAKEVDFYSPKKRLAECERGGF